MNARVVPSLLALSAMLFVAPAGFSQDRFVISSVRDIPVSASVDVLVVGGNEGGVAAAWRASQAGASALVVTEDYFLSDDVSAKARYWLEADESPRGEFSQALFGQRSAGGLSFLGPWKYKMRIEELLREAKVEYQYNTRPIAALRDGSGNIAGVVVANKAGVQAIRARVVVDATATGTVARMVGAKAMPWPVDQVRVSRIAYQQAVPGSAKFGDFYEYGLEAPMATGSWAERCRAEVLLRDRYDKVRGNMAHAHRLHMVEPASLVTQATLTGTEWPDPAAIDLGVFRPAGLKHIYVMSQAAGVSRALAAKLTRPVHLAELGQRVGDAARREAAERPTPADVSVVSESNGEGLPGVDVHEILDGHRRWANNKLGTVRQPSLAIPVWAQYDVVVVGGGVAGQAAAMAAGRAGVRVLLIEMLGQLGGNQSLGTPGYWRGYRHGINQNPPNFKKLRDANVDIWYNTLGCGVLKRGSRVEGVTVATSLGRGAVLGKVVVDATGDGDICVAAGADFHYLNDGDLALQESSYRGMGNHLYANVLPLDVADVPGYTLYHYLCRKLGDQAWDFYAMAGIRETRLIECDHRISVLDQVTRRTYADLISVSLSAYDPHGYHDSDFVYAGLMPLNKHEANYQKGEGVVTYVPLRALLPRGLAGIMVVGRCFSATHDAQATVRMQPDLINQAYGGGYAAALAARSNVPLRELDLGPVQDHLVEVGNISQDDRVHKTRDVPPPTDEALLAAAEAPETPQAMATLMYGGKNSIAPLKASFLSRPTLEKGKALCALGDATAVEYLAKWLNEQPLGNGVSYEWDHFLSVPEIEGVMWLLGVPGDERAVDSLVAKLEQCGSEGENFSRIRAITGGLGRIGSPRAAPALAAFLQRPGVMGHSDTVGIPESVTGAHFSKSYIELYAAAALLKCGDHDNLGREVLLRYVEDWRGIFHRYAGHLLYAGRKSAGG